MLTRAASVFALTTLLASAARAQGTRADYERAGRLSELRRLVRRFAPTLHWLPDDKGVWWSVGRGASRSFVTVDTTTGEVASGAQPPAGAASDAGERLAPVAANARSRNGGDECELVLRNGFERPVSLFWIDPSGTPRPYGELAPGSSLTQHTFAGHVWRAVFEDGEVAGVFIAGESDGVAEFDRASQRAAQARGRRGRGGRRGAGEPPADSAPREHRVFVKDFDVWGASRDGSEFRLSHDGKEDDRYEPPRLWSNDGSKVLGFQTVPAEEHDVPLVESSPRDRVQPKLLHANYLKPGDRIAQRRPRLFDVVAQRQIAIDEAPFADAWAIDRVRWADDGSRVYCLYNRRGHQQLSLYAIDAQSGAVRTVVEERSPTFVDYSQKTWLHWLAGEQLLWASERDGWNHLYHVDASTGAIRQITKGEWVVRKVERVDEAERQIWFTAYGIRPGQDPYYAHLARVGFDGSGLVVLTEANGTHEWAFSPGGGFFVDRWSRVDQPTVTELRRSGDGSLVAELGRDDAAELLATGFRPPQPFVAKGRDGETDIWGILVRPSNFDPARRYPVIEDIYAGPHDHFVPKRWGLGLRQRALAELGFVVVQIDGMGTNWRSRAFHDVCWQNLKDAGFPDRIAWLRAAAAENPELDLERVGIYGGSAGGQSALAALLHHGDFYDAAAADCGCHDNRMDKVWWNEAWMGWPIGEAYADNSNVTHAAKLQGKLLLTVGELDRNVDPSSTLQVVDALIRADKDFDFVLVPGGGHGVGESPYLVRRRQDFFVRHLLGLAPRR
ncbi:MAG: prolyl oligopeptidase family serine peptidase [Planctomycetota bacterium]